jgi:hypothetical protein
MEVNSRRQNPAISVPGQRETVGMSAPVPMQRMSTLHICNDFITRLQRRATSFISRSVRARFRCRRDVFEPLPHPLPAHRRCARPAGARAPTGRAVSVPHRGSRTGSPVRREKFFCHSSALLRQNSRFVLLGGFKAIRLINLGKRPIRSTPRLAQPAYRRLLYISSEGMIRMTK